MTRLPADDAVAEVLLKPCEGQFGRVRACPILLEPPAALIAVTGSATGSPELLQELVQDADVAVGCDGGRRAIAGLEPKWPDDATGAHSTPDGDPGAVERQLIHVFWLLRGPDPAVLAVYFAVQTKMCLVAEPNLLQEVRIFAHFLLQPA